MMMPPTSSPSPLFSDDSPAKVDDFRGKERRDGTADTRRHVIRLAFSVSEVAQVLGVSEKTVRRLISRRLLHPSRALRHILISKKEIDRFLDETSMQ